MASCIINEIPKFRLFHTWVIICLKTLIHISGDSDWRRRRTIGRRDWRRAYGGRRYVSNEFLFSFHKLEFLRAIGPFEIYKSNFWLLHHLFHASRNRKYFMKLRSFSSSLVFSFAKHLFVISVLEKICISQHFFLYC